MSPKPYKRVKKKAFKREKVPDRSNLVHSSRQTTCLYEQAKDLTSDSSELNISNNEFLNVSKLTDLPKSLKKLFVNNTILPTLPNSVGELKNLCTLNLSQNKLSELPDNLSDLKNLELLNLSHNELKDLPVSYAKLQRLRELNISHNKIKILPNCIVNGLGTLKILDVSKNKNIVINVIPQSRYLEKFYATGNGKCKTFPDWVLNPKFFNMKELNFDGTTFDVFNFVGKQGELFVKTLSMRCSNLSTQILDMMLKNMNHLEKLNLGNENLHVSGNIFNNIPVNSLKNVTLITELNFRGCAIPAIPSSINKLCNLKVLDIGLNNISWLPDEFCELTKLECLKIDGNRFIMFPDNIGNLKSIQELRAENNCIRKLPDSFENLKTLKFLDLFDNILEKFPNSLSLIDNLQGLDLEQNFFSTDGVQISGKPYSELYQMYATYIQPYTEGIYNMRDNGAKKKISVSDDDDYDDEKYKFYTEQGFSDEENDNKEECEKCVDEVEENWDNVMSDSDGEFDPNHPEINYHVRSMQYPRLCRAAMGFCPDDLHSERIKKEVSSMSMYGSLPSFEIQEGQFDDV